MSYINVVIPLTEFYPYIQKELQKYKIEMAMEYFDADHKIQMTVITEDNFADRLSEYYHKNLNFFFLDASQSISRNQIYKEASIYVIVGAGGRETPECYELTSLRMLSKTPDKNIKSFFNALKRKLNKDENFGKGVQGRSQFHDQHFYLKSLVGKKMIKSDLYNEKAPLIRFKENVNDQL